MIITSENAFPPAPSFLSSSPSHVSSFDVDDLHQLILRAVAVSSALCSMPRCSTAAPNSHNISPPSLVPPFILALFTKMPLTEHHGKQSHDFHHLPLHATPSTINVEGPIIVGAGPSGMAAAACLNSNAVPYTILERSDCIASLWKQKTYDRLHLHIAKPYCQLPLMPFPKSYPTFLTREQFVDYLEQYASRFDINPCYNETVLSACYDHQSQRWHVCTRKSDALLSDSAKTRYVSKWLVVASGENAEMVVPDIPGMAEFRGPIIHSSQYKNGGEYAGRDVLVVGSGNSGMEICLDLVDSGAKPSIVVRSPLHILPREMLGISTFTVATSLTKVFPVWMVDHLLVLYSRMKLGDTSSYGLKRPKVGPLELKNKMGKTPVLDVGTLSRIKNGDVKVMPAVDSLTPIGAKFVNGVVEAYDAVILATGYKSDVPRWLYDEDQFFASDGLPASPFPHNWKAKHGLYAAGLCKKGLLGAALDAQRIAEDISKQYEGGNF